MNADVHIWPTALHPNQVDFFISGPFNHNGPHGVSATPLPSTWYTLLGGLVGLGFLARGNSTKRDIAAEADRAV